MRWNLENHQRNSFEADLAEITEEFATLNMVSRDARDHIDKGDAYRELAYLHCDQNNVREADEAYANAVTAYNDALRLAPEDAMAKDHKSGVLENISKMRLRKIQ